MENKISISKMLFEICKKENISQNVLAGIIGKTQKGISDRFKNDSFTCKEIYDICSALNYGFVLWVNENEFLETNERLFYFVEDTIKQSHYGKKKLAELMGVSFATFSGWMSKKDVKINTMLELVGILGLKVAAKIEPNGVLNRDELYELYSKSPLSEEARLKKNERQREYAKQTGYKANKEYNKKTYTRLILDVRNEVAEEYKKKCIELGISYRQPLVEAIENFLEKN